MFNYTTFGKIFQVKKPPELLNNRAGYSTIAWVTQ